MRTEQNTVKRKKCLFLRIPPVAMIGTGVALLLVGTMGFCDSSAVTSAFNAIFNVLKTITTVIGAIFLIVGIVRFIIAHANEDGPNQQKAAMLIATGIALLIIGPVLSQVIPVNGLINSDYSSTDGGGGTQPNGFEDGGNGTTDDDGGYEDYAGDHVDAGGNGGGGKAENLLYEDEEVVTG